jgi:type IX secretion system PorP/SprF family membrane protein
LGKTQQETQYTQFMFNKIAFNPAYAGSLAGPTFSGIYRTQWVKLEGAPISQNFSFHSPLLNNKIGIGVNIQQDKIGPTNTWNYSLMYAYRVKMDQGHISFGLQGQIRDYRVKWSDLTATHSGDVLYGAIEQSKLIPNFGMGVYFENQKFYAGLSVPRLLNGNLTFQYDGNIQNTDYAKEARHLYLTGGLILPVSKSIKLKPALLLKYVSNSPMDIDLHGGIIFYDKFNLGATYRIGGFDGNGGESVDFVMQILFSERLKMGLAYDYTLSDIRSYHSGTYELMIEYSIITKQRGATNPRFF